MTFAELPVVPTTKLAGQVIAGACVSLTLTVKVQVELRLSGLASLAVQVTVVVPTGKKLPEAGLQLTVTPGQLSDAVAVKVVTAPHWFGSFDLTMFIGQVTAGACVSCTVTVKLQVVPICDVQVTVVVPTGKKELEAGEQVTVPQVPVVVGAKVTTAPHWFESLACVMFAGQVSAQGTS